MSEHDKDIVPVPVRIVNEEQEEGTHFGALTGYNFAGTEPAQPVVTQDRKRKRAVILVSPSATVGAYIRIGTQAQVQSNNALSGGRVYQGQAFTWEAQSALWMAPDGTNPLFVSVSMEIFKAGTE